MFDESLKDIEFGLNKIQTIDEKKNKDSEPYNIFKILKVEDLEIRHSNFLQWLFDLKNNNDLALLFITEFLKVVGIQDVYLNKDSNVEIAREEDDIDLIVKFFDEKLVLVIENKIYATESLHQLSKYYNNIEDKEDFLGFRKKYIYLTLTGREPLNEENKIRWQSLSYVVIKKIIVNILKNNSKILNNKVKIILKDYLAILKEKTEDDMDKIKCYHELYVNHKKVLCDMIKYIPQIDQRGKIIREYINQNNNWRLNTCNANTYIWFSNLEIDSALKKYNLSDRFIEICLSSEPYDKLSIVIEIAKDKDLYKSFIKDFGRNFNIKNGEGVQFYSKTLLSLKNNDGGYKTEEEFQQGILVVLRDYFENKDSEYFKIVEFIKNYNFEN